MKRARVKGSPTGGTSTRRAYAFSSREYSEFSGYYYYYRRRLLSPLYGVRFIVADTL